MVGSAVLASRPMERRDRGRLDVAEAPSQTEAVGTSIPTEKETALVLKGRLETLQLQIAVVDAERELEEKKAQPSKYTSKGVGAPTLKERLLLERLRNSRLTRWLRTATFVTSLGLTGLGVADAATNCLPNANAIEVMALGMTGVTGSRIGRSGEKNDEAKEK